jgi:hypothetical protein
MMDDSLLDSIRNELKALELEAVGSKVQDRLRTQRQRVETLVKDRREKVRTTVMQAEKLVDDAQDKAMAPIRKAMTGDPSKRVRDHVKEKANKFEKEAEEKLQAPVVSRTVDTLSFTGGVLYAFFTEAVILLFPAMFWRLYVGTMPVLLLLRLYLYKKEK